MPEVEFKVERVAPAHCYPLGLPHNDSMRHATSVCEARVVRG